MFACVVNLDSGQDRACPRVLPESSGATGPPRPRAYGGFSSRSWFSVRVALRAVDGFLANFRATIDFARRESGDTLSPVDPQQGAGYPAFREAKSPMVAHNPQHQPPHDGLPLPVLMDDGTFQLVTIPRMTEAAFEFFKKQLEAYKLAIVLPKEASAGE